MMGQIWALHPTAARALLEVTDAEGVLTQLVFEWKAGGKG